MARSAARLTPSPPYAQGAFVELVRGERQLDVLDDAVVVVDNSGVRIPIIDVDCLVLKPGARISHAASPWRRARERWSQGSAKRVSALRAAGRTCGARSDRLLFQAASPSTRARG